MVIEDFGKSNASLKNPMSSAFALLSTAGAAILIFRASPYGPATSLFPALAWTRSVSVSRRAAAL